MVRIAAAVLLIAAAVQDRGGKQEQPKPAAPDGIIWTGNWEEAVAEAKARNVPIMFTAHKDN